MRAAIRGVGVDKRERYNFIKFPSISDLSQPLASLYAMKNRPSVAPHQRRSAAGITGHNYLGPAAIAQRPKSKCHGLFHASAVTAAARPLNINKAALASRRQGDARTSPRRYADIDISYTLDGGAAGRYSVAILRIRSTFRAKKCGSPMTKSKAGPAGPRRARFATTFSARARARASSRASSMVQDVSA